MQLSEALSHGPDSTKVLTFESCFLHGSASGHAAAPTGCFQSTATCSHQILMHKTLRANYISADGIDQNDADGAQLGNVEIATAGHQVLSRKVLNGLQTTIQERLLQYATADVQTDTAALARLRAHASG